MHEKPENRGTLSLVWKSHPERDADVLAFIAKAVKGGARRACVVMTSEYQFPGKSSFSANGAWALHWLKGVGGQGVLCELEHLEDGRHKRAAYRLTPLGLQVRDHIRSTAEGAGPPTAEGAGDV